MDPDSNLAEQLRLAARIVQCLDKSRPIDDDDAGRLAELVESLDEWLREGGFLPHAWAGAKR